jgi:putative inorganic carbon (HCO3(-)) transporter
MKTLRVFAPLRELLSDQKSNVWIVGGAAILCCAGLAWLALAWRQDHAPDPLPVPSVVAELAPGSVAAMTSPPFTYSLGWQVSAAGADPPEPAVPFDEPAGVVEFAYAGRDLLLALAPGDYWAYLYVTVDDAPANQLPAIPGNTDSRGEAAGYQPLYAPELTGEPPRWLLVHRAANDGLHLVRVEIWRGWGQRPLRGVAVDLPLPARRPLWPGVALLVAGVGLALAGVWRGPRRAKTGELRRRVSEHALVRRFHATLAPVALPLALGGGGLLLLGAATGLWWLTAGGAALLAVAGVARPALWLAALVAALPFAYGVKLPLLPARSISIIDLGVLGGVVVLGLAWLSTARRADAQRSEAHSPALTLRVRRHTVLRPAPLFLLALLTGWALIAASAARYPDLALREWRTVFLSALIFGGLLAAHQRLTRHPRADLWLLVTAWLLGAGAIAAAGLAGYVVGGRLISAAEGVARVQSFYDSPNNLALYLDRTLPVAAALALFGRKLRSRLVWAALAAVQGLALLLTFSKGSLLVGLPAAALVLAVGGFWLLRHEGRPVRVLLWLAAGGAAAALVIAPFVGAERFQRLFDFSTGTGALRLWLWRSAWQMAQDFPLLGVGPDNFLYVYRSDYLLPAAWREPWLNHPHNIVLDWWTRLGVPGLLLGVAWLASGVGALVTALRRRQAGALMLGLLAGAAAALAHGLIDMSYALPDLMLVWVFMFSLAAQPHHLVHPAQEISRNFWLN